ncbi:MAG: hypothetical protein CBD27_05745 [Rhodospirillaceae bacterium TMED167]|mgnify:CR=1 FL=1|nr:MAG: hypothetical protein CBD27_05745 [Rhodospirillaceae bacterium TMED167]
MDSDLDRQVFEEETVIFKQGESAACAYLIQSGRVEIVATRDEEDIHLTSLKSGQLFGEMALMDNKPRSATAVAWERTEVIVVRREDIQRKLQESDPFIRFWLEFLAERVKDLTSRVTV